MNTDKIFGVLLVIALAVSIQYNVIFYQKINKEKKELQVYPLYNEIMDTKSITCHSLINSSITEDNSDEKSISAVLNEGNKKLKINTINSKLYLSINSNSDTADVNSDDWDIFKETDSSLIANLTDSKQGFMIFNTFVLNKKSGLALWTITKEMSTFSSNPDTQYEYFQCN